MIEQLFPPLDDGPEIVDLDDSGSVIDDGPTDRRGRVADVTTGPSDDLIAEARSLDIGDDAITKNGDWRSNEHKDVFWLDLRQLVEFERADIAIRDDRDFWTWFRKFRDTEGIGRKRGWASWRESAGSWFDQHKKTNYLTKWWGDIGYQGSGDLARKLAVALKAVQTTVSVVNNTDKRYVIEFATDDNINQQTSYTNFDDRRVVVSPQPLLDKSLSEDDAIEIETGYGLHEASHIRYTEPIHHVLTQPDKLEPLTVAARIFNIIEDQRIERLTGELFPGFAPYFDKMLGYLWQRTAAHAPTAWGPDLPDKLNVILCSVRWPDEYSAVIDGSPDPALRPEFDWIRSWNDRYQTGQISARQAIIEALTRLREDSTTSEQLDEREQAERKYEESSYGDPSHLDDEQFGNLMRDLRSIIDKGDQIETCPSPSHGQTRDVTRDIVLTEAQARELRELVHSQYDQKDPTVTMIDVYGKSSGPKISWLKPELTQYARKCYRQPTDLVHRLKSAFVFRKAAPQWSDRLLKSGSLDEDEAWRWAAGDFRIFEQKMTADSPDTQVTLLVDMSGSMNGARIASAYELANVMLACLSTMRGVRVRVRGHTTRHEIDMSIHGDCTIYRIWEPGDPVERLGLIDTLEHGWNYDGFAIDGVCQEMLADRKPREDCVLIVLSDGKPNARGFEYSGTPAMDHVRSVVNKYKRDGITIIQVAIDPEMRSADQAHMYENWIPFTDREALPRQLTQLLIKLFSREA